MEDMIQKSKNLEIILFKLLVEEYPCIKKIVIVPSRFNNTIYYAVHLGIKYEDSLLIDIKKIKGKIIEIFDYVSSDKSKEGIYSVGTYDPTI